MGVLAGGGWGRGMCIGMVKSMGCGSVGRRGVGERYVYRYGEKYGVWECWKEGGGGGGGMCIGMVKSRGVGVLAGGGLGREVCV